MKTEHSGPQASIAVALRLGASQLFNGLAAYGFLALAGRQLGDHRFAPISVLWASLFILGTGLFQPLGQELSRRVAQQLERDQGIRSLVVGAGRFGALLVAAVVGVLAVAGVWVVPAIFDGATVVYVGLLIGTAGIAASHFVLGLAASTDRLGAFGAWFLAEGLAKLVPAAAMVALAVHEAGAFGICAGIAAPVAAAVCASRLRIGNELGPDFERRSFGVAVGHLVIGSVLLSLLINGGPLAVAALAGPGDTTSASHFLAGLIVMRVPLYLFTTIQTLLLPVLTQKATSRDFHSFRVMVSRLLGAVAALAVAGAVLASVLGPWIVKLMFGPQFTELGGSDLAQLALASMMLIGAMALAQAVIALEGQARVWRSWFVGTAAMTFGWLLPLHLFPRVELGLLLGAAGAAAHMAWTYISLFPPRTAWLAAPARLGSGRVD